MFANTHSHFGSASLPFETILFDPSSSVSHLICLLRLLFTSPNSYTHSESTHVYCMRIRRIISLLFVCQDHDRRIREATQQAFEQLVLKVRRSLAPFLKSLMGHWILSQCDTYTPAASAACQAFQAAFSPNKQPEALGFCKDEILNVGDFNAY